MKLAERSRVFREIVETGTAPDEAGVPHPIHSQIFPQFAEALYRTVLQRRPQTVVEVGMAFGFSTLAILTALEELGGNGRLISIDPYQARDWHNCGIAAVRRAGLEALHQHIARPDYLALPELLEAGTRLEFAYIDGYHTFDYVLLDFWYIDRLLEVGGVVGFNDCHMKAIHRAINFMLTHRVYHELSVGLPGDCVDYSRARGLIRRLRRIPAQLYYRRYSDRYFEKREAWEPAWDFYAEL